VIEALLQTIARPEVALRVRIAAGEMLGHLGDPRLGEMVTIPAGKFVMGGAGLYDGKPQHELYLPSYQIGKYPLTNAEYARFIEAGGYQERAWWTETGWQAKERSRWTEPKYWRGGPYNEPNQPVVGISWYESVAYCRWLSAEIGKTYRLPTEAEWEKAARGTDCRIYPWGNEFDSARVNMRLGEQQVNTTTPVGIYPTGASSFGIFDCAGNVWEWCATKWRKKYPYDVTEDEWVGAYFEGPHVRVRRGGAWDGNDGSLARCACRFRYFPNIRFDFRGVRVAMPPF
jgi:formylglycine-generating enzyme required for sulfatase activity